MSVWEGRGEDGAHGTTWFSIDAALTCDSQHVISCKPQHVIKACTKHVGFCHVNPLIFRDYLRTAGCLHHMDALLHAS